MTEAPQVTTERKKPETEEEQRFPLRGPKSTLDKARSIALLQGDSVNEVILEAIEALWDAHPRRSLMEASPAPKPRRKQ